MANYATVTRSIQRAMKQWLTRPAFSLRLEPGDRPAYEEAKVPAAVAGAAAPDLTQTAATRGPARPVPPLSQLAALDFPDISNTRLSNGIAVEYAQRTAVPITQVALSFDAGDAPIRSIAAASK